jgi:hypothetical protein
MKTEGFRFQELRQERLFERLQPAAAPVQATVESAVLWNRREVDHI